VSLWLQSLVRCSDVRILRTQKWRWHWKKFRLLELIFFRLPLLEGMCIYIRGDVVEFCLRVNVRVKNEATIGDIEYPILDTIVFIIRILSYWFSFLFARRITLLFR